MTASPKNNTLIGFDIDIVDNDDTKSDHARDGAVVYNGTADNYCNTSVYATIRLVGKEN